MFSHTSVSLRMESFLEWKQLEVEDHDTSSELGLCTEGK